jgi:putative membrane protein
MSQVHTITQSFTIPSLIGTIAGGIGTIPMTLFMLVAHKALPNWQKSALPPEKITDELAQRADMDLPKPQLRGASLTSHLGYGAGMGSLYMTFASKLQFPPLIKGSLFGLVVWGASYLGWLPAARFATTSQNETQERNLLMIIAHLIWGGVTGVIADQLNRQLNGDN